MQGFRGKRKSTRKLVGQEAGKILRDCEESAAQESVSLERKYGIALMREKKKPTRPGILV